MPDSAQGVYTRPGSPIPVTGQNADAPQVNTPIDDMAAALNRRHFSDGRKAFTGNQDFNGYKAIGAGDATDAQDLVTLGQVQALIAAIQGVPTGALIPLTGMVVPASWVIANGQSLVRATYADFWTWVQASGNLAASEGVKTAGQYGPGDGSTTFTVPNLYADNGYFIRPMATGRTIGSVQADEIKAHNHPLVMDPVLPHSHTIPSAAASATGGSSGAGSSPQSTVTTSLSGGHTPTGTITNTGGAETRPKNIAYPVLIKAA